MQTLQIDTEEANMDYDSKNNSPVKDESESVGNGLVREYVDAEMDLQPTQPVIQVQELRSGSGQ